MAQRPVTWTGTQRLLLHRFGSAAWPVSLLVKFGALGLIWALPGMRGARRDNAARCAICRRHRIWSRLFIWGFVILQALGAATTTYTAAAPPHRSAPVAPTGATGALPCRRSLGYGFRATAP